MIDFHSHFLPQIDDGAQKVSVSLDMLSESYKQGVKTIIATPHCQINTENDIDVFLQLRNKSYKILKDAMAMDNRHFPKIVLGCEYQIFKPCRNFEKLRSLCIENTNYILVEMPYSRWNENYYDYLYELTLNDMRPIIAHIERFISKKKEFYNLFSLDLLYQVNAGSFLSPLTRKHIPDLFTCGAVQFIGSDMHNMDKRAPNMKEATDRIIKSYGNSCFDTLLGNAEAALKNEPVKRINYEQMPFFKKLRV